MNSNRRVSSLLVHVETSRKTSSPVLQACQKALNELYSYGDYEKAADAVARMIFPQRACDHMETVSRTMEVSSMSSFDSSLENSSEDDPLLKDVL